MKKVGREPSFFSLFLIFSFERLFESYWEKLDFTRNLSRNDWRISGNTQYYHGVSSGFLLLSRSEKSREKWMWQGHSEKCRKNKKTLCSTEIVCYTRSYFFTFERCYRMRLFALFRMRAVALKQNCINNNLPHHKKQPTDCSVG